MARGTTATPRGTAPRPVGNASPFWLSIALVILAVVAAPTLVFLIIAMAPTLVAFIVDRSERRYATLCVGGINGAGTFPYVLGLWKGGHTVGLAMDILSNVFALGTIYAAAAFGWILFLAVPPVVAAFLTLTAQRRVGHLRARQRQIIEEWGEDVVAAPSAKTRAAPGPPPA